MDKVLIHDEKVREAQIAAKELEKSLKTTYEQCQQLLSFVHSAKWSGKARDSFLTYMEILEQFHKDMVEAAGKQTKALHNLDGYRSDFLQDSSVREVRNL